VLAKQIEAGALADVFFSADHEWMRVKIAPGFDVAGALWS